MQIEKNKKVSATTYVSADLAITSAADDRLKRAGFSKSIANVIVDWTGRESLVIALFGPWGSGKTSVKNMMVEELRKSQNCPFILEFNPWQWAGHDEISKAFFRELEICLGREDAEVNARRLSLKLKVYAELLGVAAAVGESFQKLPFVLLLFFVAAGFGAPLVPGSVAYAEVVRVVALSGALLVGLFGLLESTLRKIGLWQSAKAEAEKKTLPEIKGELTTAFKELTKPVLVIVDDLDRLMEAEFRTVFQLVKANADFPNLIFLLPFQRSAAASLKGMGTEDGYAYLEKIVQVSIELPSVSQVEINKIFYQELNQLMNTELADPGFDRLRWSELYEECIQHYFPNLRTVKRFVGALAFNVERLRIKRKLDVNPIDLIALECFRMFEPQLYGSIGRSKAFLTTKPSTDAQRKEAGRTSLANLVALAASGSRERVEKGICILFPNMAELSDTFTYSRDDNGNWDAQLRICCKDHFARYFELDVGDYDLHQFEIDQLIGAFDDPDTLRDMLHAYQERGLIDAALARLVASAERIRTSAPSTAIAILFEIREGLPREDDFSYYNGSAQTVLRIVQRILNQYESPKAAQVLADSIPLTTALGSAIRSVSINAHQNRNLIEHQISLADASTIKQAAVDAIRKAAYSGALRKVKGLNVILWNWSEWAPKEEAERWVKELINDPEGLVVFLTGQMQITKHDEGNSVRTDHFIRASDLEKYVDLEYLEKLLGQLEPNSDTQASLAISAAKEAIVRRRNGTEIDIR